MINVTKAVVMRMKYGHDVVMLQTEYDEPFVPGLPIDHLDLMFRAPRMQGAAYVEKTFPDLPIEVTDWSECAVTV